MPVASPRISWLSGEQTETNIEWFLSDPEEVDLALSQACFSDQ
jgi:hypothetical protein